MSAPLTVAFEQVVACYPNGFPALQQLNLHIPQGSFYGLLGLNGAGKTSTIATICGFLGVNLGTLKLFDEIIQESTLNNLSIKKRIGWMAQEPYFHPFETAEEVLVAQCGYHGFSYKKAKRRSDELLARLQLEAKKNTQVRQLSGGMKRRLMLARAMVHQPELLLVDEPSAGLDLETRNLVWELLKALNKAGTTILLTTHYLEEAEQLCSDVGILKEGKLITEGQTSSLVGKFKEERVLIELLRAPNEPIHLTSAKVLSQQGDVLTLLIDSHLGLAVTIDELQSQQLRIKRVQPLASRLERLLLSPTHSVDEIPVLDTEA